MVALGEMWRNLSPEEKLAYNNKAKFVFQAKQVPDNSSEEAKSPEDKQTENGDKYKKQEVESESDSNEEMSDSSQDPEDVN